MAGGLQSPLLRQQHVLVLCAAQAGLFSQVPFGRSKQEGALTQALVAGTQFTGSRNLACAPLVHYCYYYVAGCFGALVLTTSRYSTNLTVAPYGATTVACSHRLWVSAATIRGLGKAKGPLDQLTLCPCLQ